MPKELISRFVKLCPTCQARRGASRNSPAGSEKSPDGYPASPEIASPASRRDSIASKKNSVTAQSPLGLGGFRSTFEQQNRWMSGMQPSETKYSGDSYANSTFNSNNYTMQDHSGLPSPSTLGNSYGRSLSHMSFSSANPNSTSGFPSSNVRSTNNWQTAPPGYGVKHEHHYG